MTQAIRAAGDVIQLERALNGNLAALAGAKNFEDTVMSLSAAIHLLTTRLGHARWSAQSNSTSAGARPRCMSRKRGRPTSRRCAVSVSRRAHLHDGGADRVARAARAASTGRRDRRSPAPKPRPRARKPASAASDSKTPGGNASCSKKAARRRPRNWPNRGPSSPTWKSTRSVSRRGPKSCWSKPRRSTRATSSAMTNWPQRAPRRSV